MEDVCPTCGAMLERSRCRRCPQVPTKLAVELPPGWKSSPLTGLPDMTLDQAPPTWTARNRDLELRVQWRPEQAQYTCKSLMLGSVLEARFFVYPHEVVEWLHVWFPRASI